MDVHTPPDAQSQPHQHLQPVRSHEDVLAVIAEVERQLERLRNAEADGARDFALQEAKLQRLEERENALHSGEALLVAREAQLRAMAESIQDERVKTNERATEVESRDVGLSRREADLAERETDLVRREASIAADQDAVVRDRDRIAADRATLESLREELADREARGREECDRLREVADEARDETLRVREQLADAEASLRAQGAAFDVQSGEVERLRSDIQSTQAALFLAEDNLKAIAESAAERATEETRRTQAELIAGEYEATVHELRQKLADSERERALLAATAHEVQQGADAERRAIDASLESKRQDLASIGVFLKNRKMRIDRARRLCRQRGEREQAKLREATEGAMVRVLEEERLLKKEREELRQVQDMLTVTEQAMLRSDARHRVVKTAALCGLSLGAIGIGSWFAAGAAFPQPTVVAVDLVAKSHDGAALSPEAATSFESTYSQALRDDAFRAAVQKRLQERGVVALGSPAETGTWFDGIRTDSDGAGSLRLIAAGPDVTTATLALDTVATTLVNEAPKLGKGRTDLPRITLAGQSNQPGHLTFSTVVPQTDPNDRVMSAAMIFSGVVTLGAVVGFFLFGRLAKAKRSFEESEPA